MKKYIIGMVLLGFLSIVKAEEVDIPCVLSINNLKGTLNRSKTLYVYSVRFRLEENVVAIKDLDFVFFTDRIHYQFHKKRNIITDSREARIEDITLIDDRTMEVKYFILRGSVDSYKKIGFTVKVRAIFKYVAVVGTKKPIKKKKNFNRISDEISIVSK